MPPRVDIHFRDSATLYHWPRRENVIDAPAFVLFQGTGTKVIPERELLPVGMEMSEDICKAPRDGVLVSTADLFVKTDVFQMFLRTVNIDGFGRDVHVSAPDRWLPG